MSEIVARTSEPGPDASGPTFAEADILDDAGHVDPDALDRVLVELRKAGRFEEQAKLLTFAAERCPSAERTRRAWLEVAELWLGPLGSARRAEPFLTRVLATDPESHEALEGARSLALAAGRWDEAADLTEQLAALHRGQPEGAGYWIEVADLARGKLDHPERALRALARARGEDPTRLDVLERALDLLVEQERWPECAGVLDEAESLIHSAGPAAKTRLAARYLELGLRLSEHALHHRSAEACLNKARELGDAGALRRLDELAALKSEWRPRAQKLVTEGLETRDKRRAARLYVRAAELHHVYGRDPVKADEHVNRALILRGYEPALGYLETVYLAQGRADELIKRLNALLAGVRDTPARIEISMRLARLTSQIITDPGARRDALTGIFERVLALDPGHREAARAATALLTDAGRHEAATRVLENHLGAISDDFAKLTLHLQLGRIYAEVLGDSARARAHFEAVVALRPTHFRAATALRALYRDADEAPLLLGVLRVLLEYMPDVDTRSRLLDEMETVADQVSPEDRYAVARRRFDLFPADESIERDFAERSRALSRELSLARGLEAAAGRSRPPRSVDLFRKAAQIYDARLPRPDDALRCLRSGLALAPDDRDMQAALERLLRQQDDPAALAELLRSRLGRATDPDEQTVLQSKLGEVLFRDLEDLDGAAEAFEAVLAREPTNPTVLAQLDALHRARGDASALERVLARRERVTSDPEVLADVQSRRALLLVDELDRVDEGVDLFLELLEAHPERTEYIEVLDRILATGVREADIARALELQSARRGDYERQVEMLSILIRTEDDLSRRKSLALRAAHLCDARLGVYAPAFDYLALALALDPSDDGVKDHMLEAAARIDAPDRAVRVFTTILERDDLEPDVVASLAQSAAELQERELEDPDAAVESYRRVLAADPSASSALASLERILTSRGRYGELAELLRGQLDVLESAKDRARVLVALAEVLENHLSDVDGAIDACRQAVGLLPDPEPMKRRLADLLERSGRRRELLGLLEELALDAESADAKSAAWSRLGDLRVEDGQGPGALDAYAAALEAVPDHPAAVAGLLRCLDDASIAPRAGRILAPALERTDRFDEHARALEASVSTYPEGPERAAVLRALARLQQEGRADADAAYGAWARAFREEPALSTDDLGTWESAAIASRRARDLAGVWSAALESGLDDLELRRRLARMWDGPAAEPARAKEAWEIVRAEDAGDLEALEALERLTASTDPDRLVEILEARAEVETEPEQRADLLRRAAALTEESLGDLAKATAQLERAHRERPQDASLLAELIRLYGRTGAREPRRAALERQIALQTSPVGRADAITALARHHLQGEATDAAVEAFAEAIAACPDHAPAREGLEALLDSPSARGAAEALEPVYRRLGNWSRLVEVYEVRAKTTEDPRDALEQWVAIRAMWEDRLGRVDAALEAAAACVDLDPDDPEHWMVFERLAEAAGQPERVVARSARRRDEATEQRPERAVEHAARLERLGVDAAEVREAWDEVRALSAGRPELLEPLAEHYARTDRARELAETLSALALVTADPQAQAERHRRAAHLWMDRLSMPDEAVNALEHVIDIDPEDEDALERLDRLHAEARRPERRAPILERRARLADPAQRGALLVELARLRRVDLQDPSAALAPLEAAIDVDAPGAVDELEDVMQQAREAHPHLAGRAAGLLLQPLEAAEAWPRLVEALAVRAAGSDDPTDRVAAHRRRAALCESKLEQPDLAFAALLEAAREAPADPELAAELERLADRTDGRERLADHWSRVVAATEDEELRLDRARRACAVYESIGRTDAALAMIRAIRRHDPSDSDALAALQRLARAEGSPEQRVELYRSIIEETPPGPGRGALWLEVAALAERELEDPDRAFDAYRHWAEEGGTDPSARERYRAVCERTERWNDLAELLGEDLETAEAPDDVRALALRLGTLHRDRREDPAAAVAAFTTAHRARPEDAAAREALAGLMKVAPSAVAARAAQLVLMFDGSEHADDRLHAQVVLAEAGTEPTERAAGWTAASRMAEAELGRPDAAYDYAARAVFETPADPEVRERAEALATDAGRWADLEGVYQSVLSSNLEPDAARAIHTLLAERHEAAGDRARAIAEYQLALEHAPEHPETLSALERLLEGEGDFEQLSEVFRRRIAATEDAEQRIPLMRQFADLQATRMNDLGAAISTLRRLLDLEPSDQAALIKLDRWLEAQGRGSERREGLQRLVASSEEPSVRLEARVRWAKLEAEELGDSPRALELAAQNLAEVPGHAGTRAWLEARAERAEADRDRASLAAVAKVLKPAYAATEDWNALIGIARQQAEVTVEAAARAELSLEIARAYEKGLEQPDLAFATALEALRLAPGRPDAAEMAERLAEDQGLEEELVDGFVEVAPSSADPEAAVGLLRTAARIQERLGTDPDRAESIWQDILRRAPDDDESSVAVEGHARRRDDSRTLVGILEQRLARTEAEDDRFTLTSELGRLHAERLDDAARAREHLRAAHRLRPTDRGVALALARILHSEQDAAELYEVFSALEAGATRPADKIPVLLRMGHLAENVLRRPDAALDAYDRVLELDPLDPHAFAGLSRLYEASERWSDLVALLEARIEGVDDADEEMSLQRRLGTVRATRMGSPEAAVAAWRRVLEKTPNDEQALSALRDLYRRLEQWEPLTGVLRRLLTLGNEPESLKTVRFELAEVLVDHRQAPSDAVEVARRILDMEPHTAAELFRLEELLIRGGAYAEAVKAKTRRAELSDQLSEKLEVLEEVAELYESQIRRTAGAIQTYEQILALDPTHDGAFEGLARLYEGHADHRSLVTLIGTRIRHAATPKARERLHLRVADLQERALGSKDLAFAAACAAFTEGGASDEAQEVMQRLARETDNEDMLIDILEDQVDSVPTDRALELRLEVARLGVGGADEPERAERHLEMLLAMQPGHPEASRLLEDLLRDQERWDDLVLHLRDQAELVNEPERSRQLLEQVAAIEEQQLDRKDAAIQTWSRMLDRHPGDPQATAQLERLYRDDGRTEALLDLLEQRREEGDLEQRVDALMQIARIREHDLGQPDFAIESLQSVLEIQPTNAEALAGLERLYVRAERWTELLDVLTLEREIADGPSAVADISTRMAAVHVERLGDPDRAIETYETIFDVAPGHLPTARALVRLLEVDESRSARRAELLELIRTGTDDADERRQLEESLAALYAGRLDNPEGAQALYRGILAEDESSIAARQGLAELAEARNDWPEAVAQWRALADLTGGEAAGTAHRRTGEILRDRLSDEEGARSAFERALDVDPADGRALEALERLAESQGDAVRGLEFLERRAEAESEPELRTELYHRAASRALEGFDDVDRAIRSLQRGLEATPGHRASLIDLTELLFSDEQYEAAVPYLDRLVEVMDAETDRVELSRQHYRRAYIAERDADAERALEAYLASYEADGSYLPTLEGLGAALVEAERHEDALRVYQTVLVQHRHALTDAEIVDLHHQVGLLAQRLDQLEKARKSFDKALELDPRHPPTLGALADLCEASELLEDAYDYRERMLEQLYDDDARFEALVQQGQLCRDRIREPYRAIDAFGSALALRPDDIEVQKALIPLYESTRQFGAAVKLIVAQAESEESDEARRDLWLKAGDLQWEQDRSWAGATQAYNRALDIDPLFAPSLQRLERTLAEAKQWKALEENYIRMIRRLPKENKKARVALWRTLGELYSKVLKDPTGAARAYEVVMSLGPDDPEVGLKLAQMYRRSPERKKDAVGICQRVLPLVPDPTPATRLLAEIAYEQGQYDAAFCGLGGLMLIRAAQEEEVRAYRALLEKAPAWPAGGVTETQWQRALLHPACRGPLGRLVGTIYRFAPDLFSGRRRNLALKRKERVDLSDKGPKAAVRLRYFDVWGRVAGALGLREVDHYRRPGSVDPPLLLPGAPRSALYVGEKHEVFKTMPVRQVTWLVGRQVASGRPELAPVRALAPGDFVAMVEAFAQLYDASLGAVDHVDVQVVTAWSKALRSQVPESARNELRPVISEVIGQVGLQDLLRYVEGAEHTASRAALLVAGDWITASRGVGEADGLVDMPRDRRVRELLLFSTSSELAALRDALSLRVQV